MSEVANTEAYERWNGDAGDRWLAFQAGFDAMVRRLTPRLLAAAGIRPGDVVVDVGCGSGDTSRLAAARAGRVLGIDLSARQLDRARELAAAEGLANLEFVHGDAQTYPFPRGGVDVVLSRFGAMGFVDPVAAFGNFGAALRPGGRLAIMAWQDARSNELVTVPFGVLAEVVPGLGGELPEDLGPFARRDPAGLRELLVDTGFSDVRIESVTEPVWLGDTADAAVELLSTSGPAYQLTGALDAATRDRAWDAVRAVLEERRAADGVWLGSATLLVQARR